MITPKEKAIKEKVLKGIEKHLIIAKVDSEMYEKVACYPRLVVENRIELAIQETAKQYEKKIKILQDRINQLADNLTGMETNKNAWKKEAEMKDNKIMLLNATIVDLDNQRIKLLRIKKNEIKI